MTSLVERVSCVEKEVRSNEEICVALQLTVDSLGADVSRVALEINASEVRVLQLMSQEMSSMRAHIEKLQMFQQEQSTTWLPPAQEEEMPMSSPMMQEITSLKAQIAELQWTTQKGEMPSNSPEIHEMSSLTARALELQSNSPREDDRSLSRIEKLEQECLKHEEIQVKHEELHEQHRKLLDAVQAGMENLGKTLSAEIGRSSSRSHEGIAEQIMNKLGSHIDSTTSPAEVTAVSCEIMNEILQRKMVDRLRESFWEVGLVCGHPSQSPAEIVAAMLLLAMLIGMNALICAILLREFSGGEVPVDAAQKWRAELGHWSKYAALDGQSMVHRMCRYDNSLMLSDSQRMQFVQADSYHTPFAGLSLGVVLCLWCVLVFFFLIWEEMQKAINRALTVFHLKREPQTNIMPSGNGFIMCGVSPQRFIGVLMLCLLRIGVAFIFLYSGTIWLISTEDIENLILNSVALVFVLEIDELIYHIACPSSIQALVDSIEPLRKPSVGPLHLPSRAISTFLGAALAVVLFGTLALQPFADDVFDLKEALCGGDTNFVIGKNPSTGIVFTYHYIAAPQANVSKLMPRVVRQLRDGNINRNHITSPSLQVFDTSLSSTLAESVAAFGGDCSDIKPNDPNQAQTAGALLAAMKDSIGASAVSVTTCSQLNFAQCAMDYPIIRLACPETCGCSSAFNGNFLTYGCPISRCAALPSFVSGLKSQPQYDIDPDVLPLVPEWLAYWQTFEGFTPTQSDSITLSRWSSLGLSRQLLVQIFHQSGCRAISHFSTHTIYQSQALSIVDFFCSDNFKDKRRSLSIFCPTTCNCSGSLSSTFCPRTPSASANASIYVPFACAGIHVRNASLLDNAQCKQDFSNRTSMSHPVGWYNCSPNAYNGKNLYSFVDASNVRWQVRWESVNSYDWGAYFFGKKIALAHTSKWTLSSIDQSSTFPAPFRYRVGRFFSSSSTQLPSVGGWFPRNSSNTDVDCATGDMTTDGADKYFVQPAGSIFFTCHTGYVNIFPRLYEPLYMPGSAASLARARAIADCKHASKELNLTYWTVENSSYPSGCYVWAGTNPKKVYLNERFSWQTSFTSYADACHTCHPICMKCDGSVCKNLIANFTVLMASNS